MPPADDLAQLLTLDPIKPDAWVGTGPDLGWGRIYGGLIVAQALRAATLTVPLDRPVHSLHAYFIRAGDEHQNVLFEVERLRDGRSFSTRQVIAYQSSGAILNLIASFQDHEPDNPDVATRVPPPDQVNPDEIVPRPTQLLFEHRVVRPATAAGGEALTWLRALGDLGDDPAVHACALAYLSDEDLRGVAIAAHPLAEQWEQMMAASLDHAVWFHRPARADDWLLFSVEHHGMANARGLAIARVFDTDGNHVATVAQEGLGRRLKKR